MRAAPAAGGSFRAGRTRSVLVDRGAVLVGRFFRGLGRGWRRWGSWSRYSRRAQKNVAAAKGGGLGTMIGALKGVLAGTLTSGGGRSRMLSVEERLTLGPKQHMYLVRYGERRLLVASAVEGSLSWIDLPEEDSPGQAEACDNTQLPELRTGSGSRRRRWKPRSFSAGNRRSAVRAAGMGGRR